MTKIGSVWVTGGAAVIAILLSFCNIITTLIASIPAAVMGGVCLILYGFIASNGLKTLIDAKVDMSDIQFSGMALATIFGIVLNLTLPKEFAKNKDKK